MTIDTARKIKKEKKTLKLILYLCKHETYFSFQIVQLEDAWFISTKY